MRSFILPVIAASTLAFVAHAAQDIVVTQKDKQFSSTDVSLKQGDSVNFVNDDTVAHNLSIKAPDGTSRLNALQKTGESTHATFDAPGDWRVLCLIHPKMKVAVHVQ